MSLRAAYEDPAIYRYLKLKNTLAATDCNAHYSDGKVLPVLIRDQGSELFVELEDSYTFVHPQKLPGFKEYQLKPEGRVQQEAEAAKVAEPEKPKNFAELQQRVEQQARNTMAERFGQNKTTNSDPGNLISSKWATFAEAGKRARDAAFRSN
jgi:hypothetical protein